MTYENDFYREITTAPPLPPDLYGSINRALCRRARAKKALVAIAASIVLLIGAVVHKTIVPSHTDILQPEVASELQIIHDYLNSNNLEGELKLYAVVEEY
ncbi:MAG: hypothetical protein JXA18_15360 [Chitinispirillaceae bacterium]|nr:hypothetical protein [Chitinispirillaceae bacterium]